MRAAAALLVALSWAQIVHGQARAPRLAELLGMSRHDVDAALTAIRHDGEWVVYENDVAVLYEADLVRRVRARLPDPTCSGAVATAGFDVAAGTFPRHDVDGVCTWTPESVRHSLAPHVRARWRAGILDLQWVP